MDAISYLLEPFSETIGKIAGTITTLQFLSGIALLNDIRKKGCSDVYAVAPFLGGIALSVFILKLGQVMGDQLPFPQVNRIGFAINTVFMVGFYYYASNKNKTKIWAKIGNITLFLMACIAYANLEDPSQIEVRLFVLITGILVWLIGSPLLNGSDIIEMINTEGMPIPIIFAGQLVATSWTVYAFSIRNHVMVCFFVGIQLLMFVIYPYTPAKKSRRRKKASKKIN